MKIKLSFLGAARNVTGSRFLLDADGVRLLVDCGFYQERQFRDRNWDPFPVPPESITAALLTHAHLDHCGLLPKLVNEGFRGKIYCTSATAEIARIILLDSAHIQEEDAAYKKKRHRREGRSGPHEVRPLYTVEEADRAGRHFVPVEYGRRIELAKGVTATFHDAGHVFGSSTITVGIDRNGERRTVLFSGDVGRDDRPIIEDPDPADQADYALIESTYGDRDHEPVADVQETLARIVNETFQAGGNVVIPSFALERSQELLYHLSDLRCAGKVPETRVFLDSPMAIRITRVFQDHPELFDKEMTARSRNGCPPFDFPGLRMTETVGQSKAINDVRGGAVIIAGSGMCTGGRVKHHIVNNISEPQNTILFVGYQAQGTLGRHLLDRPREVRIHGMKRKVMARIARIHGFSAHADRNELLAWLKTMKKPPRRVFVVHGETDTADAFRDFLTGRTGWNVVVPDYQDTVELD